MFVYFYFVVEVVDEVFIVVGLFDYVFGDFI